MLRSFDEAAAREGLEEGLHPNGFWGHERTNACTALFAIREPGIEDVMCRNIIANGCRTRYKLFAYRSLTGTLHTIIVKVRKGLVATVWRKGYG